MNTEAPAPHLDAADGAALGELLGAEAHGLETLYRIIEREHAALLDGDARTIEAVAAEKERALRTHAEQQRARLDWLARRSVAPGTPLAALAAGFGDTGLDDVVARLATLARECDESNRRNGALIQRLQQRTRNALGVLRGSGDKGDVYSLSGDPEHGSDRRSLGKA